MNMNHKMEDPINNIYFKKRIESQKNDFLKSDLLMKYMKEDQGSQIINQIFEKKNFFQRKIIEESKYENQKIFKKSSNNAILKKQKKEENRSIKNENQCSSSQTVSSFIKNTNQKQFEMNILKKEDLTIGKKRKCKPVNLYSSQSNNNKNKKKTIKRPRFEEETEKIEEEILFTQMIKEKKYKNEFIKDLKENFQRESEKIQNELNKIENFGKFNYVR